MPPRVPMHPRACICINTHVPSARTRGPACERTRSVGRFYIGREERIRRWRSYMKYLKARGGSMIFHSHGGVFARSGKERKRKIEISDATGLASPSSSRRCIAHRRSLIFPLGIFLLCSSPTTITTTTTATTTRVRVRKRSAVIG